MIVSGFQLREAIRRWTLRRDAAASQFDSSLTAFDDEVAERDREGMTPDGVVKTFFQAESAIARLQTHQTAYNLHVKLDVPGIGSMTLLEAIKRIGGYGRVEKMWRGAVAEKKDRYSMRDERVRKTDETVAKRLLTGKETMERAMKAAAQAGALRAAIAEGNSQRLEIDILEPSLLTE